MSGNYRFLILNGPNLGHIGTRQPEIYGTRTLEDIPGLLGRFLLANDIERIDLEFFQSNFEGALIDRLEVARAEGCSGVVLNAGAYAHTSLALADCLAWVGLPVVEVHLSNILARKEPIRHTSLLAQHCLGSIAGFGVMSYVLGIQALFEHLEAHRSDNYLVI